MVNENTDLGIDLEALNTMTDEELDAEAAKLGITDDDGDDDGTQADPTKVATAADGGGSAVGGGPDPKPQGDGAEQPKLTGQALLETLQGSPEAQALIKQQLDGWLSSAAADAAAKKQQDEFNQLISDGNYEEIGKRYVRSTAEQEISKKASEEASVKAYGEIYTNIFKQPELQALSDAEKVKLDASNYQTDAEYVLALTDHIASKRGGTTEEETVNKKVEERLETLRNMKAGGKAGQPSVSALPGGLPRTSGDGPQTSRSLIKEGYNEILEERADQRVGV